jgi:hypothetical protein
LPFLAIPTIAWTLYRCSVYIDGDSPRKVPRLAAAPIVLYQLLIVLTKECPSKLIGFDAAEPGHIDGKLVNLVLKQEDA